MRHGIALDLCMVHNRALSQRADDDSLVGVVGQRSKVRDPRSRKLKRHHLMKSPEHPKGGKRGKRKRPSAAQLHSQSTFGNTSYGWDDRTEEERRAWDVAAKEERTSSKGRTRRLSGKRYYMKINGTRAFIGLPPLPLPTKHSRPKPNPVGPLRIIKVPSGIALLLSVPSAPAEHTKVLGSPPQNPGRRFCADFRYLGLLPARKGNEVNITEQYVKKFGNPPPGSRVFIRTQQQVDGQQDLPLQTDALVPGQRKRRRATGAG